MIVSFYFTSFGIQIIKLIGMKTFKSLVVLFLAFLTLSSMTSFNLEREAVEKSLLGTWNWQTVIDARTDEDMGLEMITMGMAKEIKTEFRKDYNYIEYKNKLKGEGYSSTEGIWRLSEDGIELSMSRKGKTTAARIIRLDKDSLLLEMRYPYQILMVKEKQPK